MIPINTPLFLKANGCPTNNRTTTVAFVVGDEGGDNVLFDSLAEKVLASAAPLCQSNVTPSFIEGSLEGCDYMLVLCHYSLDMPMPITPDLIGEGPESVIYAFATCIDKRLETNGEDDSLYVDAICSNLVGNLSTITPRPPSGGKALLNIITTFGKERGYRYIALSALINVINYYRKLGFRHLKNGETVEPSDITRLAEANAGEKFDDGNEARLRINVERAFKLAHELNPRGVPEFNPKRFWRGLQNTINDDTLQGDYDEDTTGDYIAELPPHVIKANGSDGLYDLVASLIRHGFGSTGCSDITQRLLVREDAGEGYGDAKPGGVADCTNDGFSMRKPLFPTSEEGIDGDILRCDTMSGGKRRSRKRSRKHKKTKKRKSLKRKTRRHRRVR